MTKRTFQILALAVITTSSSLLAQHMHNHGKRMQGPKADLERGKQLFTACIACHGNEGQGNPQLKAPRIGGQHHWYVQDQLVKFKKGHRGSHPDDIDGKMMVPIMSSLTTDADILNVAAYVSNLKPPISPPTIRGNIAKGKFIFANCSSCHGPIGQGQVQMRAPALVLLDDWYLKSSLIKFRKGIRGGPHDTITGKQMKAMMGLLKTDEDIDNVVAYIKSVALNLGNRNRQMQQRQRAAAAAAKKK